MKNAAKVMLCLAMGFVCGACVYFEDLERTVERPDGGNTSNGNVSDPCVDVVCAQVNEVCVPSTGECGVVACGFTNEADGYQSTCPSGSVCQLDLDGMGYCAPPCSSNADCIPGVGCEQKYASVVGGGLCIPGNTVSCEETIYAGLCLGDELCNADFGECVTDGSEVTCFSRPDEFNECALVLCEFNGAESDDSPCFIDPGMGGAPALQGLCHHDPTAPSDEVEFTGYCAEACRGDSDCVEPGAFCNANDGRCYPNGDPQTCPPLTFPQDGECLPHRCDSPDSPDGDLQCADNTGVSGVRCSVDVGDGSGVCHLDCRSAGAACDIASSDVPLTCDGETGRCVEDTGCNGRSCFLGQVCYEESCQEPSLNTSCSSGDRCRGDEECLLGLVSVDEARCALACAGDQNCPSGSVCVVGAQMVKACATRCATTSDCGRGLNCVSVVDRGSVCLP